MGVARGLLQLQHPEFLEHVDRALERADLPAHLLTLELTESVLVASGERAEQQLGILKARGVRLALDDFGTGYASLAYLQRLPVDVVKIDRSFTAKIDSGEDDLALLEGIVGLGKALGLELVAEGIERNAQQGIVQNLGCHGAQGFHFGRPEAAAVATEALRVLDVPRDLPDLNPEPERESPADADDLSIADLGSGEPNVMEELAAQQSAPGAAVYASSDVVSADAAPVEAGPKVPNFRGKTMRAVVEEASAIGLPVLFDGSGIARAQVPAPGTVLHAGERVRVQFAR